MAADVSEVDGTMIIALGQTRFIARHGVLRQLTHEIVAGLEPNFHSGPACNVYVGIHAFGRRRPRFPGRNLGIQTEHFFDQHGLELHGKQPLWKTIRNMRGYDRVLDINAGNARHYRWLPQLLSRRIDYGPHIFPSVPADFRPGTNGRLVFFGALNERRERILQSITSMPVDVLPPDTYGDALKDAVADYAAVLNIHFQDGIYTEFPRLLTSYLFGKAIVSEPLASDLRPGGDYVAISAVAPDTDFESIFQTFSANMVPGRSFAAYLRMLRE